MQPSENAYTLIKHFEASDKCELSAYQDGGGVWTIGWGTTLYPNGTRVKQNDKCTLSQANYWMQLDVIKKSSCINTLVKKTLQQNQFDTLVDFVYNLGQGVLEHSNLLRVINNNPNDLKLWGEFTKWRFDDGKASSGLERRRKSESWLYFKNEIKLDF